MSLIVGDVVHNCIWITGEESKKLKKRYEKDVRETIDDLCAKDGVIHGPITVTEKHPMDHDVPPVPGHIQGSKVRLLYLEATVVKKLVIDGKGSFIDNLEPKDLEVLRRITRESIFEKAHMMLSDEECDEIIDELGPDAAVDVLRENHVRTLH